METVIRAYRYPEQFGYVDIEYDLFAEDLENRIIVEVTGLSPEEIAELGD